MSEPCSNPLLLTRLSVPTVNVVIMAKPAIPGEVKTRLIGRLGSDQVAQIHAAMLTCVLKRTRVHIGAGVQDNPILAMDNHLRNGMASEYPLDAGVTTGWRQIDQGTGDLGQRLTHVWHAIGDHPVIFLGADSPDIPAAVLGSIISTLDQADVAVGPVDDGGYWTLAARRFQPSLLTSIDWGTPSVYYQTLAAAKTAGLSVVSLQPWHDVDRHADLVALRKRIGRTQEPALASLRSELDRICQETSR